MGPVNKAVKDVICDTHAQHFYKLACANLCQSALLPQLDLFPPICAALVLYSLCLCCISCGKWQRSASWKLNEDYSLSNAPPEIKCATTFWSEHDLNHYPYETSVATKLGIETSNYSGCQF